MGLSQITFVEQKLPSRRNKFLTFQWIASLDWSKLCPAAPARAAGQYFAPRISLDVAAETLGYQADRLRLPEGDGQAVRARRPRRPRREPAAREAALDLILHGSKGSEHAGEWREAVSAPMVSRPAHPRAGRFRTQPVFPAAICGVFPVGKRPALLASFATDSGRPAGDLRSGASVQRERPPAAAPAE